VVSPLLLVIPPLASLLPGGMLTTAMIELADGAPTSGASRLIAGGTRVLLLVFGIATGEVLVGLPAAQAFSQGADNLIGWWAPWLGPLVFTVGIYLYFVAPRRSLVWLCLVVYAAWRGQQIGDVYLGGYLSGFVGALVMTIAASVLDRIPSAPPFLVLLLPAFWLLVPGVLAVVGVAELVGTNANIAVADIGTAVFSIVSIALGLLVGVALVRAIVGAHGYLYGENRVSRGGKGE
jgi:uncharacterized membrane protein YjjB (DUF3815 family)